MLLKLLLTLSVIVGAVLFLRVRTAARAPAAAPVGTRGVPGSRRGIRALAFGLVALMVFASGAYIFHLWWDARRVITVRVVNANNNRGVEYQAYKGDVSVEGRTFVTLDGRRIALAPLERLEVGSGR